MHSRTRIEVNLISKPTFDPVFSVDLRRDGAAVPTTKVDRQTRQNATLPISDAPGDFAD
jgi:hypothetical protein